MPVEPLVAEVGLGRLRRRRRLVAYRRRRRAPAGPAPRGACGSPAPSPRRRPRRSGRSGRAPPCRRSTRPASTGFPRRSRCRSPGRARPGTRDRGRRRALRTFAGSRSKANSGVWTPTIDEALVAVRRVPAFEVREGAQAVDARVRPEVDEDDLAAQLRPA